MNELEYRMCCMVPYNLSDIQKGIQALHGVVEYNNGIKYLYDNLDYEYCVKFNELLKDKEFPNNYIKWSTLDKTVILLNGGPTSWAVEAKGMLEYFSMLKINNIPFSYFQEPDLNNALTAICFLVDERVYDKKKYPDYDRCMTIKKYANWRHLFDNQLCVIVKEEYNKWVESIGGESNVFLREFLKDKRLA